MDGVGQRTTSFRASSVRLAPRLLSVPEGTRGVSLASARRGEPRAPRTLVAVAKAPNVRASRRPMRVRIDVAPPVLRFRTTRSGQMDASDRGPRRHDAYASCETSL